MLVTCFSIAPVPMTSARAIAALVRPSAMRPSTSRSRGVSALRGSRRRAMSCVTTSGSSTVPPDAMRRTASSISSSRVTRSLSR